MYFKASSHVPKSLSDLHALAHGKYVSMKNGKLLKHQLFVLVPTLMTAASLSPKASDPALLRKGDLHSIVFHAPRKKMSALV